MSQQDQQVLPSQAQPAASTENSAHSNLEPLRVLDALTRDQVAELVGGQEKRPDWPVAGGEYDTHAHGEKAFFRVRSIEDGRVYYDLIYRRDGEVLGHYSRSIRAFKEATLPEDQSPIPALAKALKDNGTLISEAQAVLTRFLGPDGIPAYEACFELLRLLGGPRWRQVNESSAAALALVGEEVSRG